MGEGADESRGRPVRWGILATGGIAAKLAGDLATLPGAEVAAVGSRSPRAAEEFARRFGIPRAYGDWAALAADPEVDVIHVATPHSAHHPAVRLCLEAGKPVLCEKPFTMNEAEARELVALARERGVFLMEAMWMYCNPSIRRAVELVHDGAIGEVVAVHADFGIGGPFDPGHRLLDPALGGGALLDLGVYPVSFAHLLLGEPAEVSAVARIEGGVDLNTGMLLGYASGAVAALTCSLRGDTARTAVVTGERGRIAFPRGFFSPERFVLHREGSEPEEFAGPGPAGTMAYQAAEVMRCLRAGETESPLVPLDGSLAVMRTLDAVRARIGLRYAGG
ncbi:Gfo/Idh/MocA family protein [Streptomyces radicis]|uniref:Gfo/Idh/MocA family oxidoreductase n=1 Tax=Streptomyces radicis TaxID=1750517 RepID=A0A3A9WHL7_9ACTN|nr:Gfo/Idh/MocA family oxidoreductase [Streptomyces radicis]RKN12711.1 gfo/Idh/MocA family oxidoreductase [Streptomyces radicis]RKN27526.1 gfo/Idh/MocA family oxidoreductase [Streptomyces radicis]